ncbi:9994_t:CDS:10 [Funneliformis caledonium]|uniref:Vacuolar protein sorting-associated protein 51 homolog n=1 Tax=Funneliformis caledonium TaxID=1117310 RepID=A0A9N9EDI4_9GLOM|nr:9994_t:CDS:10 [Funneliformis caledonium]
MASSSNSHEQSGSFASSSAHATPHITLTLPRKSRAKDLLRKYYTLDGKKADPLDIDNSAFEAEKYVNNMLVEKHLSELMQRDNDLSTEIRQLDGDMKTLVYENYSKFISATDTIRKMKSNVENMESEMDQLSQSIKNISNVTTSVNSALGPKRDKIRQLTGVHDLLKKIQFIFELPTRLNHCLDQKSYAQAVRYYAKTSRLLDHYRNLSVFSSIEMECKEIMDKVTKRIRENMTQEDATGSEISDCMALLITLKELPQKLAKEYLELQKKFLSNLLEKTIREMSSIQIDPPLELSHDNHDSSNHTKELSPNSSKKLAKTKLNFLNQKFLKELNKFVESFNGFFLTPSRETREVKSPGKSPKSAGSDILRFVSANLDGDDRDIARQNFMEFIDSIATEYFAVVDNLLDFPEAVTNLKPSTHLQLLNDLYYATLSCNSLCTIARFEDRVNDIIVDWEIKLAKSLFGTAEKELMDKFVKYADNELKKDSATLPNSQLRNLQTFILDLETVYADYLTNDCLKLLEECVKTETPMMQRKGGADHLLERFKIQIKEFWHSVIQSMSGYVASVHPAPVTQSPPPIIVLMMSRVLLDFGEIIVMQVYLAFSNGLYKQQSDQRREFGVEMYNGFGEKYTIAKELVHDVREIIGICKDRILETYVEIKGNQVSAKIRDIYIPNVIQKQFEKTNKSSIPERVTSIWSEIITDLVYIEKDVVVLYGGPIDENKEVVEDSSGTSSNTGGGGDKSLLSPNTALVKSPYAHSNSSHSSMNSTRSKSPNPFTSSVQLTSHIDKLFSDRIEIYSIVEMSIIGIMTGIVKILLKTWIEMIRLNTLTNNSFQQIQVDSEYMRVKLWRFIEDERMMNTMLQELASSAFRRCFEDPLPLVYADIEMIVNGSVSY